MAFPDILRTVEDPIAEGDKVVMRETVRGTHQAAFEGVPATERKVQFGAIAIYRIVDDKIVETYGEADFAGLMGQLTSGRVEFTAVRADSRLLSINFEVQH